MYDYSDECARALGYSCYDEYLRSEHWKKVRKEVLSSAGNRCQRCGSPGRLQVHHKTYENIGQEHVNDLLAVCRECHERIHFGPFYIDDLDLLESTDDESFTNRIAY